MTALWDVLAFLAVLAGCGAFASAACAALEVRARAADTTPCRCPRVPLHPVPVPNAEEWELTPKDPGR